ncbi:MAG TPA: 30S ribosomal protein S6 [Tepidisphaeraceae bacterium]|nr:30S ribosomal protein S6 [Tepidisphaeraceae bacterium]
MAETAKADKTDQYEGMFLLGQSAAADLEAGIKLVRGIIERHGGEILLLKKWDERKLSYEVEKQKRGTYIISYFKAPRKSITPIERDVNLSEDVLRVLVSKADHLNQKEMDSVEPQPIIREERPSWERDDRPPRRDDRGGDRPPREDRQRDDRPPRARREEGAPEAAGAPDKE